ncbi:MAG: hypothetical protein ACK5JR_20700 [Tropicimonas sp.]|uniref:hypothetical protein n=1 Tax=Tropicimonas sp. TaxID=2067044 RepID=UPI003A865CE1
MTRNRFSRLPPLAALLGAILLALPTAAQEADELDRLFTELARPEQPGWRQIEEAILLHWSRSGSPAMDLLLRRGTEAMETGDLEAAMEHLGALTDHAPDFAEGWNARATVFFLMGAYGPSLADIRRTLALNPQHFGALTGLATIMEELGYEAQALEAWRAVEAIHPHRPELHDSIERLEKTVDGERL